MAETVLASMCLHAQMRARYPARSPHRYSTIPLGRVSVADRRRATDEHATISSGIRLDELVPPGMINLRGSADQATILDAAATALGCRPPVEPNRFSSIGELDIVCLGPNEWLIIAKAGTEELIEARLSQALAGRPAAITDVSANRARFRLTGPGSREALLKGCAIDFHPRAFCPGQAAQTLLGRAQVLIIQRDVRPTYDILPRRSFARYVRDWLEDSMIDI